MKTQLEVSQILAWADAYHARTGSWPKTCSGRIPEARGETWGNVDSALRVGVRGLGGGSSLPRLLAEQRGVQPYSRNFPQLEVEQILTWADAYHARTGRWPRQVSGEIPGTQGMRWYHVDRALRVGLRGLAGGSSLAGFLAEQRGVPRYQTKHRPLTEEQIVAWAGAYHARTGRWPTHHAGRIGGTGGETWRGVDLALHFGRRGFPGGCTLGQFLAARHPGHRLCPLTEERILAWADAHHARTGQWPNSTSGPLHGIPELTWSKINRVLANGTRGLPGGSSLARLLRRCRPLPALTVDQILAWADLHHGRSGDWPRSHSGPIADAPGERWSQVDTALKVGARGLGGGSSLARLLAERRGVRSLRHRPELTMEQILRWADAHHDRTGYWPNFLSGPIDGVAGETWAAVNGALVQGCRGLRGQDSLARLLAEARGAPYRKRSRDGLTHKQVLGWACAHRRRTGRWPTGDGGLIPESSGDTWRGVDSALRKGSRGLRGGSSISQLIGKYRLRKARLKGQRKREATAKHAATAGRPNSPGTESSAAL